jgi:hypothetical protein
MKDQEHDIDVAADAMRWYAMKSLHAVDIPSRAQARELAKQWVRGE